MEKYDGELKDLLESKEDEFGVATEEYWYIGGMKYLYKWRVARRERTMKKEEQKEEEKR